jgi:hypothetical protein
VGNNNNISTAPDFNKMYGKTNNNGTSATVNVHSDELFNLQAD